MSNGSHGVDVRGMKILLLVSSLASLGVLAAAAYHENFRGEWRSTQQRYAQMLDEAATDDTSRKVAASFLVEHKQLYLSDLRRIDRCTTCHVGVENPAMAGKDAPFTQHTGELLRQHPSDKFGCTICHAGQGRAVTKEAAHGWREDGSLVPHMETPLLRGAAVYTGCGRCHYETDLYGGHGDLYAGGAVSDGIPTPIDRTSLESTLPGAHALAEGKRLVLELGCLGCHTYRNRGGNLGPDLTYVGDKTKHDFDFSHIEGEHTVKQWLIEHFLRPREVSPGTAMPEMGLTPEQAENLALYMMGLHRKTAPASHTPRTLTVAYRPNADSHAAILREASDPLGVFSSELAEGGRDLLSGETLYQMFCSACHGADGLGSTVRAGLWPKQTDPWGREWERHDIVLQTTGPEGETELMVPSLNHPDTLAVASDDYLHGIIASGRRGTNMLGWNANEGGLTDGEIDRLVAYIRNWQGPGPPLDSIRASRGDARYGRALYRSRCAGCHGKNGRGGIGVALNVPSFLAAASDEFLRDAIVLGRANTAMPSWKQLSADEVSDLLAYIRGWQALPADKDTVLQKLAEGIPSRRSLRIAKSLYRGNCATCHGTKGEGTIGPSLNTTELLSLVSDEYLYTAIVEGRPDTAMPAWKHLSVDDVVDLINYLRQWNKRERRPVEAFRAHGDWDRGRIIFQGACSGCHGRFAEGGTGPQLVNPTFLETVDDAVLREWISHGKAGTPMLGFLRGNQGMVDLSPAEIEDVISFLRRFELVPRVVTARPGMGLIPRGKEVYLAACASCHGPNGEGMTGSALANPHFLRSASDGYLQATMILGRDGTEMRAMGKGSQGNVELSAEDIENVAAYLRSWEGAPSFSGIPRRYVTGANLQIGRELYTGHCSGCHGAEGRDGWAPAINNRDFLASATDGFLQATIAVGRSGTAMRPFGVAGGGVASLSGEQIDEIVAYIRTWAAPEHRPMSNPDDEETEQARADQGSSEDGGAEAAPG